MSNISALPVGTVLRSGRGEYKVVRVIGSGGFGITYLVSSRVQYGNISMSVMLAVKEHFVKDLCDRDTATSRIRCFSHNTDRVAAARKDFVGEARKLQQLCKLHHNIVQVNEVFEANDTAYYVMEYIDGESLADYVQKRGRLSASETVALMRPVIAAVAALHVNRMTHLDIKPANIMLGREEDGSVRPVLIDFGLAKHYDTDGNATSTLNSTGYSLGYAPIEQYHGIKTFSPTVDVYSLGATIFFCLTGKKPVEAEFMTPAWINENLQAGLPAGLRAAVIKSLSQRPENRPVDAAALLAMIDGVNVGGEDTVVADVASPDETVMSNPIQKPILTPFSSEYVFELSSAIFHNLDLAFRYNGEVRYISVDNWKRLSKSNKDKCERLGIVIDQPQYAEPFLWSLYKESRKYKWDKAMSIFYNQLPTKQQGEAIIAATNDEGNPNPVGEAIKVFGGDSNPYLWYWTRDEYASSLAWNVSMNYGVVYYASKAYSASVRQVVPILVNSNSR